MRKLLAVLTVLVVSLNLFTFFLMRSDQTDDPPIQRPEVFVTPMPTVPSEEQKVERGPEEVLPEFVEVPTFRNQSGDSVYDDVLSHSKDRPFGNGHGRATNVHETAHGIHSYLRNTHGSSGRKVNGFYVLNGRGVIIEEPRMRKRQVAEFVPQNLRSYRYSTYITGQGAWDDTPLYIYDEWTAYVLGGMTNVEDVQKGRYSGGWTDGVSGCIGFSIYAIATCMAVEKYDPEYWKTNQQFRNFTIFMLRQAHETFMIGREMEQFKWDKQDRLLEEFLHSEAAAPMRKFVREKLNGVWLEGDLKVDQNKYERHQRVPLSPGDDKHRKIQP